jgi:SAM-dependent methyltransferase
MTALKSRDFGPDYFQTVYRNYHRQNPPRKMAFYRELVAKYAPGRGVPPGPGRPRPAILELGCAFGKFLASLDSNWRKFGVDLSEFGVERAREAAPGAGLAVGSCSHVPFKGPFDVVAAFDVIEHVEALDRVGDSVSRTLADGGTFLFVVPVYDGPLGGIVRSLDKDPTHIHKESRRFWLSWAARRFEIREWWGITRYLLPGGVYIHCPSKFLRSVAPAIAVVAQKPLSPGPNQGLA